MGQEFRLPTGPGEEKGGFLQPVQTRQVVGVDDPDRVPIGLLRPPQGPDRGQLVPRHRLAPRPGALDRGQGFQDRLPDLVTAGTNLGFGARHRPCQGGSIAHKFGRSQLGTVQIVHNPLGVHLERKDMRSRPLWIRRTVRQHGPALHLPSNRRGRSPCLRQVEEDGWLLAGLILTGRCVLRCHIEQYGGTNHLQLDLAHAMVAPKGVDDAGRRRHRSASQSQRQQHHHQHPPPPLGSAAAVGPVGIASQSGKVRSTFRKGARAVRLYRSPTGDCNGCLGHGCHPGSGIIWLSVLARGREIIVASHPIMPNQRQTQSTRPRGDSWDGAGLGRLQPVVQGSGFTAGTWRVYSDYETRTGTSPQSGLGRRLIWVLFQWR